VHGFSVKQFLFKVVIDHVPSVCMCYLQHSQYTTAEQGG